MRVRCSRAVGCVCVVVWLGANLPKVRPRPSHTTQRRRGLQRTPQPVVCLVPRSIPQHRLHSTVRQASCPSLLRLQDQTPHRPVQVIYPHQKVKARDPNGVRKGEKGRQAGRQRRRRRRRRRRPTVFISRRLEKVPGLRSRCCHQRKSRCCPQGPTANQTLIGSMTASCLWPTMPYVQNQGRQQGRKMPRAEQPPLLQRPGLFRITSTQQHGYRAFCARSAVETTCVGTTPHGWLRPLAARGIANRPRPPLHLQRPPQALPDTGHNILHTGT